MDTDGTREAFDRADRHVGRAESNPLMSQADLRCETQALRRATAYYLRGMSLYVRGLIADSDAAKLATASPEANGWRVIGADPLGHEAPAPAVTDGGGEHGSPATPEPEPVEWHDEQYMSSADLAGQALFVDIAFNRWRVFVDGNQDTFSFRKRERAKQHCERIARAKGRS